MAIDYLSMVRRDGSALKNVPEALKTPEICDAAVQKNGYALQFVPEALMTPEVCLAAVQQDGVALCYVPKALRTPEVCLAAVQQDGLALKYVPEALRTPEICDAAIQQDPEAARYLPPVPIPAGPITVREGDVCLISHEPFETGQKVIQCMRCRGICGFDVLSQWFKNSKNRKCVQCAGTSFVSGVIP